MLASASPHHTSVTTYCVHLDSPQVSSALFFTYNTQLGPPYHILVDTNFINFSIQNKLDLFQSMMDCLYAKCERNTRYFFPHRQVPTHHLIVSVGVPCITDCVMGELEKLGTKFRVALRYLCPVTPWLGCPVTARLRAYF